MFPVDFRAGRKTEEVIFEMKQIRFGHQSEGSVGKNRKIVASIRSLPQGHGPDKILIAPSADSCFRMGGDVAAVENAERGLDSTPACHGLTTIRLIGVASASA